MIAISDLVTGRQTNPQGHVDMLFLKFRSASASRIFGPVDSIDLRGAQLLFSPGSGPAARYQNAWILDGTRYNDVECRAMLPIQFEDSTGRVEPVMGLRTVFYLRGAYAFAGRERIAKLEPLVGSWLRTNTQESWPGMRIFPAPSA